MSMRHGFQWWSAASLLLVQRPGVRLQPRGVGGCTNNLDHIVGITAGGKHVHEGFFLADALDVEDVEQGLLGDAHATVSVDNGG
jgi:hypothetical protein